MMCLRGGIRPIAEDQAYEMTPASHFNVFDYYGKAIKKSGL